MHGDIRNPIMRHDRKHPFVQLAGGYVINDHLAETLDRPRNDFAAERIDGNKHLRTHAPDGIQSHCNATPLLLNRHLGSPRPRRITADIEHRSALGERVLDPTNNGICAERPTVGKNESGVTFTIAMTCGADKSSFIVVPFAV